MSVIVDSNMKLTKLNPKVRLRTTKLRILVNGVSKLARMNIFGLLDLSFQIFPLSVGTWG